MPSTTMVHLVAVSFLAWGGGCAAAGLQAGARGGPDAAQSPAEEVLVRPSVLLERQSVRPGETVWAAVRFDIKPGWHTYWPGQNDTGAATEIVVKGPAGLRVGPVLWPPPHRHVAPGDILDHVHEGSVTALVPLTMPTDLPADLSAGERVELSFELSWLVCKEACIPGWETLTATVELAGTAIDGAAVAAPEIASVFSSARARLAEPAEATERIARVQWEGQTAVIRVRGAHKLAFYPHADGARVEDLLTSGAAVSDTLRLTVRGAERRAGVAGANGNAPKTAALLGLLEVFSPDGISRVYQIRSVPPGAG